MTKQVKLLRQNFKTSKQLSVGLAIAVNYESSIYISSTAISPNNQSQFNTSVWNGATWAGGDFIIAQWRSVAHKPGYALSLQMEIYDKDFSLEWNSNDMLIAIGSAF